MNIFLIRHGDKKENDKNHESLELTEKGFKQADMTGKRLIKYGIERIYTSNMVRAIQTAEGINKYLNLDIVIKPEIREICMGACDTKGWKYLEENYPDFLRELLKHEFDLAYPPDGECGEDVWKRSINALNEIVASGYKNVALVTHGGVIRILISGFLGFNQAKRFNLSPLENCSISTIKYNEKDKHFCVHCFNDYAHLEEMVF